MAQESVQSRKRGRVTGPGVGVELARASEGPTATAMVPQLDEWPALDAHLSLERQLSTPWALSQQLRRLQTEHQQRQQQRATPSAAFPFSLTVEQQVPDVAFSPRFQPPFDSRGAAATLASFRHPGPTGPHPAYPCARDDLPRVPSSSFAAISTFQLYQANNNAREIPRSSIAEQFEAIAKEHRSLSRVNSHLSTVSSSVTFEDGSMQAKRSRNTFEHHIPSAPAAVVLPTVPERPKAVVPSTTGKLFQSFFSSEAPLAEPELSSGTEGPSVPSLGRELKGDHKVPRGDGSVPSGAQDVNEASSPPLMSASKHVRDTNDEGDRQRKMAAAQWPTLFGVKLVPASDS